MQTSRMKYRCQSIRPNRDPKKSEKVGRSNDDANKHACIDDMINVVT